MRKPSTIAAAALAVLALGACRQEPTAKPVDTGTEVTAQSGATPEPVAANTPAPGTATPPATVTTPAAATPTPEATVSPVP